MKKGMDGNDVVKLGTTRKKNENSLTLGTTSPKILILSFFELVRGSENVLELGGKLSYNSHLSGYSVSLKTAR